MLWTRGTWCIRGVLKIKSSDMFRDKALSRHKWCLSLIKSNFRNRIWSPKHHQGTQIKWETTLRSCIHQATRILLGLIPTKYKYIMIEKTISAAINNSFRRWPKWRFKLRHHNVLIRNLKLLPYLKKTHRKNRFIQQVFSQGNMKWVIQIRHRQHIIVITITSIKVKWVRLILSSKTNPWAHRSTKTSNKIIVTNLLTLTSTTTT